MKVRVLKRIITEGTTRYDVEIKRWYWPFWEQIDYSYIEKDAIETAKRWKNPATATVWSSEHDD